MKAFCIDFAIFLVLFMWNVFLFMACIPYVLAKLIFHEPSLLTDSDFRALSNQNPLQ